MLTPAARLIAETTQDFLSRFGLNLFFSPPHTPEYNGAIEAAIGATKTRTEVAGSQTEANATA